MSVIALCFSLLPLLLIFILLIGRNMAADKAGVIGWLCTILISCAYFDTPVSVALTATFSGIVASLPIGLAMGASNFQILAMAETGAMARVVSFIKGVSPTDQCIQMLLINCGIGVLFTSLGALTLAIFPPILLALGYTTFAAIALPCIGYTGACIYAIMGVPVVIFASIANIELHEAGILFAEFLPLLLSITSLACLWLMGGITMLVKGCVPALLASIISGLIALPLAKFGGVTLTGFIVGAAYCAVLLLVLAIRRQPLIAKSEEKHELSLLAAISPWLLLIVFSIAVNSPFFPFFDLLFKKWAMPVEIIPNKPERLRIFWQSYLWIPLATLLCTPFLRGTKATLKAAFAKTLQRAPRPILAVAAFFSIASLYVYSGYTTEWTLESPQSNMVSVLSTSAAGLLGAAYVAAAPFLGLLGGVISGSQSGSIAMLTKLHYSVAGLIGQKGSFLALLSAIGGGLSGAISPAKVMNAAAVIGKIGEEGPVLRSIIGIVLLLTAIISIFAYFGMAFFAA